MKKILALSLVLILSISILVGCQQSQDMTYEDGTYTAESEIDDHGWKGVINITVKDGKITEVNYDEFNEDGDRKSEDQDYSKSMENASGVTPADAYGQLEDALVNTQNPDQIDAVAGATSSSEQFKELAKEALNK